MGPLAGRLYFEQERERLHFLQAPQRERFCQKFDSLSGPKGAGHLKQVSLQRRAHYDCAYSSCRLALQVEGR